jgi:hypothetical protein
MNYDTYFTCFTCISNGDWSLGNLCCEKCKCSHDEKHVMKEYFLRKYDFRCDVCNNAIIKSINYNQICSNLNSSCISDESSQFE